MTDDAMTDEPGDTSEREAPEFGPSGYLPDRAARRARKIILRAPLGMEWIVASLVAGVVVVAAGVVFLTSSGGPPGEPYVPIGPVAGLPAAGPLEQVDAFVVTTTGRPRAFAETPADLRYCAATRQLEAATGVWSLTGRGLGGAESLREHPTVVADGVLYVDPTTTVPGPTADDRVPERGCAAG